MLAPLRLEPERSSTALDPPTQEPASIAVLGPDEETAAKPHLDHARAVGEGLAAAGYHVIVAGSSGTSAAASDAALAAGGHVLSVVDPADAPPGDRETRGVSDVIEEPSPLRRIEIVLEQSDALILFPGDLTALAALLQVWSWGSTPDAPFRQLVLLGESWPAIVKSLADAAGLDRRTRAMVTFAATPKEAVEALRYYIAS